jgi:hypothetical protein
VRAIVRDRQQAFVGSQGLRKLELDGRREVGVIVKERAIVTRMAAVFQADWALTKAARKDIQKDEKAGVLETRPVKPETKEAVAKVEVQRPRPKPRRPGSRPRRKRPRPRRPGSKPRRPRPRPGTPGSRLSRPRRRSKPKPRRWPKRR